ncbi:MAG TPA: endonuclease [Ignavibacteria bacterium]|nr:endonuclease [Ignavibacteria bacterium]
MKKLIVLLALVLCLPAFSQIVPFTVNLDTSITKTLDSSLIYVKNPTNKLINVTSIRTTSPFFFTRVNTLNIAAGDSTGLWAIYSSYHNLTYRAFLLLEAKVPNAGLHYSLVYGLIATSKYPDAQYAFTQGLSDEPLKAALKTFTTTGYISLGYNTARDRMFETVDDYGGDTIECIYSGRRIYATTRTQAQNQSFDTEHTWPQSFFNENEPMRSDIHHLFPTYSPANNARSSYPFGFVVSNITYQDGGSKLGRDINNNIVFEPRDVQKGNTARAVFYFLIRYQNWENYLALAQETALRQFHAMDTVNARERLRNDRIKVYQNNRNPFADHPEFVERIAAFYTTLNTPLKAKITASPYSVKFDTLANPGDTVSYFVTICNYGNTNLNISSVTSNNPVFTVESFPSTVTANQFGYAKIKFTPTSSNTPYTGELTINNSDSTMKIALNGMCGQVNGITPVSGEIPRSYDLSQNYPNPFNPVTNIKFSVPETGFVKLAVYDIMGREVNTLVSQNLKPGVYLADWDASMMTSGVYFYKITAGRFSETKRMILVK